MLTTAHTIQKRNNRVLLIYTGGTIGMGKNPETGALEPLDLNHLVSCMPEFSMLKTGIETYQFTQPIDSSDMSPRLWSQLVRIIAERYERYDGFVILHGTDTMAYTASALSFMLENLTKPVILTGSQLPINPLRTDERCAFTSAGNCCAATGQQRLTPTASTPSSRSTSLTWPKPGSISYTMKNTSSSPISANR